MLLLVLMHLATGCKLVEAKMPGEPLPKEEFVLRGQTREFANVLSTTVQHAANSIASQTNDPAIRTHCVQWKIGAVSAIRAATLRSSPKLALLDAWAFCRQMNDISTKALVPASWTVSDHRRDEQPGPRTTFHQTARTLLSGSEFSRMDKFLGEYVARYPLQEISFDREPVVPRWEDFEEKPSRIPPAGTDAEALSDFADRSRCSGNKFRTKSDGA